MIASSTVVVAAAKLVDTRTGTLLWEGTLAAQDNSGGSGNILADLLGALVMQVAGHATDHAHDVAGHGERAAGDPGAWPAPRSVLAPVRAGVGAGDLDSRAAAPRGGGGRRRGRAVRVLVEFAETLLFLLGGVVLIGALAHVLGWLLVRRRTAQLVWRAWNVLGALFLGLGVLGMAYAWGVLGLQSGWGSLLLGLGLLLASAGLWMLVPV